MARRRQLTEDELKLIKAKITDEEALWTDKLETNTVYYLENLIKEYIYKDREKFSEATNFLFPNEAGFVNKPNEFCLKYR